MRNIIKTSMALTMFLSAISCEKETDISLMTNSKKLVVEGNVLFGLDTILEWQEIKLTQSADYTGTSLPEPVSDATVSVFDGDQSFSYVHIGNGVYRSSFIAEANRNYTLNILYGGEEYEAKEAMRSGPAMDSLSVNFFPSALGSPEGNFITINTIDPEGTPNFYLWRLFINNKLVINPSPGNIYRLIQEDEFFDGQPLFNYLPYDNFPVVAGDRAIMEQLNISKQMFNYYYSIFNLTASSPVSGDVPPGKILGNIVNKSNPDKPALGYFGACSISVKKKNL